MTVSLDVWPPPTIDPPRHIARHIGDSPRCDATRSGGIVEGSSRRWATRLAALLLIGGSLMVDRSVVVLVPILFVLVVPFEKLFPRHRGQRLHRPGVGVDVAHALASPLLGVVGLAAAIVVGVASLAWVPGLLLRPLVGMIPPTLLPFVGIALFDLASYWVHRWSHEVPLLWKFHSVHHSTEHLDWVSGFRNHPFDGAIVAPPFFLLIAAGFDATFTGILALVQIVTGLFLHANVRWRLKPLHRVVITPEFHHWHHTNERDAHNSNYSIFLPLWDMVFGTYFMPDGRRPEVYGIDEAIEPTLWGQIRYPFAGTDRPVALARYSVAHPVEAGRRIIKSVASLLRDVRYSTTRRTRNAD